MHSDCVISWVSSHICGVQEGTQDVTKAVILVKMTENLPSTVEPRYLELAYFESPLISK